MRNLKLLKEFLWALLVGLLLCFIAFVVIPWVSIDCLGMRWAVVIGSSQWWFINILSIILCAILLLTLGRYTDKDWGYVPVIGAIECILPPLFTIPLSYLFQDPNGDGILLVIIYTAGKLAIRTNLFMLPLILCIGGLIRRKKEKEISETPDA